MVRSFSLSRVIRLSCCTRVLRKAFSCQRLSMTAVLTGGCDSEVGFEDLDGMSMIPANATCSGDVCSVCVVSVNILTSCG